MDAATLRFALGSSELLQTDKSDDTIDLSAVIKENDEPNQNQRKGDVLASAKDVREKERN